MPPLDADMIASGEVAIASVLYSYGADLDPIWLVGLWGLAVAGVTLAELEAKERKEKREAIASSAVRTLIDTPRIGA